MESLNGESHVQPWRLGPIALSKELSDSYVLSLTCRCRPLLLVHAHIHVYTCTCMYDIIVCCLLLEDACACLRLQSKSLLTYSGDDSVPAGHNLVLATHHPPGLLYTVFQQSVVEHASIMNIHVTLLICITLYPSMCTHYSYTCSCTRMYMYVQHVIFMHCATFLDN